MKITSAARARCSMQLNDEGETKPGGLDSTLMTTGLQGLAPPRRPHHEYEDAAVVMSTTSCSEVLLRQGGLGVMKIYVHSIRAYRTARSCTRWGLHAKRYKCDVQACAEKGAPTRKRASGGLSATSRLVRRRRPLPMVEETAGGSARKKRCSPPGGARQRRKKEPT